MNDTDDGTTPVRGSIVAGALLGLVLAIPALFLAVMSAGAGYGDYAAARLLFPLPMLLTLLEGRIGMLSMALALVQFPLYGGLLGWTRVRGSWLPAAVVGLLHLVGAIVCFSGALPNFS